MNFLKIAEELRENAAELKDAITSVEDRVTGIEEKMDKIRKAHVKMETKLDLILAYLKRAEETNSTLREVELSRDYARAHHKECICDRCEYFKARKLCNACGFNFENRDHLECNVPK